MDDKKVIIIGTGITGIATALDIAEAGGKVIMIESSPFIGGKLSQLDRQFPNDACGMCQVYPFINNENPQYCLRRVFEHPNIQVITQGELLKISGDSPPYKILLKQSPRGVEIEKCIGCKKCEEVCPVEVDDMFNAPMGKRKAIYLSYPLPYPNVYAIDWDACTKCGECVKVCPADCIRLDGEPKTEEIEADDIVITSGFQEINIEPLKNYGYGRFENVVTGLELERMISEFGPLKGELKRPSDGKVPEKIAFLHCIGSRDKENPFCSSVCCMYTLKEIHLIKRLYPSIELTSFYMDMRTYGKGYYRYFKGTDARFIPQRPGGVEKGEDGNLIIKYEDETGKMVKEAFDIIVLAAGQIPNVKIEGIEIRDGYLPSTSFSPVKIKDGIYAAGSALAPKDITDSIIDAHAVVSHILPDISDREIKEVEPLLEEEIPPKMGLCLCKCGGVISDKIDFEKLKSIRDDVEILELDYLCTNGITQLKEWIKEKGITRLTIGACAPFIIDNLLKEQISPVIYDIVDLKEGFVWNQGEQSTAEFLIKSSLSKIENYFNERFESLPITQSVVVIGGGIAGMNAALKLSESGVKSILIEKSSVLGGNANDIKYLLTGENLNEYLKDLINRVGTNENIEILKETEVISIEGSAGNFQINIINKSDEKTTINAGAIIVATGAVPYKPVEYLYGKNDKVMTQLELEKRLEEGGGLSPEASSQKPEAVVMIQCVGSRNEEHPWCSRVCCSDAIKNALKIKEKFPETDVFILYRDIMMYGKLERYYTDARNKGVVFVRFKEGEEPEVKENEQGLEVVVKDTILNKTLKFSPDFLVLSTGILPQRLTFLPEKIEYTEDGFLKEANQKFKPLETNIPGIFIAGLAHSPRNIPEAIVQGEGSAGMAISLLKSKVAHPNKLVSIVHERRCAGCGFCVDVCPYGARYIDEDTKKAKVYSYICQGCGNCVTACPSGATEMVFATKGVIEGIDKI